MKLHEIVEINEEPYFRKMRIESGFLYNFFNSEKDEYNDDWIFAPDPIDNPEKLMETTAAEWVSCENSLPEAEGEYLTYNKENDRQTVQYFDGRVWGYLATVKPVVTHWTKLLPVQLAAS